MREGHCLRSICAGDGGQRLGGGRRKWGFQRCFPTAPEPDAGRTGVSGGWGEARPLGAGTAPEALQTHCASGLGPMLTHVGAFTHREGTLTSPPVTGEDTAVSHEGAGLVTGRPPEPPRTFPWHETLRVSLGNEHSSVPPAVREEEAGVWDRGAQAELGTSTRLTAQPATA